MENQFRFEFEGVGTKWIVKISEPARGSEREIVAKTTGIVRKFEGQYSRFLPTSLVSQLNKWKEMRNPPLEMLKMLDFAAEIFTFTKGAFDICLGKQLEDLGYDRHYSFQPKPKQKTTNSKVQTGFCVEKASPFVKLPQGVKIDLGGMGKGWLIDKLMEQLKQDFAPEEILINAGGDIRHFAVDDRSVTAALENPFDASQAIGTINFSNSAIACSAPNRRRWRDEVTGQDLHHLIAKSTNLIQHKAAVFTHAPTALLADTASTAIFVGDPDLNKEFEAEYKVSSLVVGYDGHFWATPSYEGSLFNAD